ncbi:shikimate dehydrogenase [Oceanihabitans sediminis]|uniref:Shikimate dehydrogenase n=1 Tax=Oceanihabitans sediminis TaxID=1812012 RepID=A0A368P4I3_9FLAO|nr:shikimate dehydrogenase [Oceanihabitans sediminis]MDX1277982.1 shikimate dehydrogenase [Oceanihabitans sediminis]MDX1774109.1 shikimate dehydrogenase [Oceanihabitans sediminis]RBP30850.1 shikimate dehydrogenase [Oceanihabitans sediminis]RCU56815.1 shikimate dehydrogenase [Oceanihabitans sediminis]
MRKFGLIGKNISYSFSENYFTEKFRTEKIADTTYHTYDLDTISELPKLLKKNKQLKGLNVTIPYKEQVVPYLDEINKQARKIGAINTIKITKKGKLKGYNTDYYGFKQSLLPHLKPHHTSALILGTGGASKAVAYALKKLGIKYFYVSRNISEKETFTYQSLSKFAIQKNTIIINCTPLGTYPNIDACPDIPYQEITEKHLLFDLIYNPEETKFLQFGKQKKATTINGLRMLQLQADKSWQIWNK